MADQQQPATNNDSSSILSPPRPARKAFRKWIGDEMGGMIDWGQHALFRGASRICRSTPDVVHDALRSVLRDATFYALGRIRQVCYGNLTSVRGEVWDADEIRRFTRNVFDFWGKVVLDFLRLRHVIDDRNWKQFVRVEHLQHLEDALASPGGTIVAGPHMGNWELIGQSLAWMDVPVTSIARRRKHSSGIDRELMDWRTRWGQGVVYSEESPRKLMRLLKDGEVLGIVADQYSGREGIFTDFFGAQTAHYPGVAVFANRMEVPVVPVHCYRERDGTYVVEFDQPIDPVTDGDQDACNRNLIAQLFRRFESYIRRHPYQWLWFHRKWRDKWLRDEHIDMLKRAPYLTNH